MRYLTTVILFILTWMSVAAFFYLVFAFIELDLCWPFGAEPDARGARARFIVVNLVVSTLITIAVLGTAGRFDEPRKFGDHI